MRTRTVTRVIGLVARVIWYAVAAGTVLGLGALTVAMATLGLPEKTCLAALLFLITIAVILGASARPAAPAPRRRPSPRRPR